MIQHPSSCPIPSLHHHPQQLQLLPNILPKEVPVGKPDFGPAAAGCPEYQPRPKGEFFRYRYLREEILLVVFRDLFPPVREVASITNILSPWLSTPKLTVQFPLFFF